MRRFRLAGETHRKEASDNDGDDVERDECDVSHRGCKFHGNDDARKRLTTEIRQ